MVERFVIDDKHRSLWGGNFNPTDNSVVPTSFDLWKQKIRPGPCRPQSQSLFRNRMRVSQNLEIRRERDLLSVLVRQRECRCLQLPKIPPGLHFVYFRISVRFELPNLLELQGQVIRVLARAACARRQNQHESQRHSYDYPRTERTPGWRSNQEVISVIGNFVATGTNHLINLFHSKGWLR